MLCRCFQCAWGKKGFKLVLNYINKKSILDDKNIQKSKFTVVEDYVMMHMSGLHIRQLIKDQKYIWYLF